MRLSLILLLSIFLVACNNNDVGKTTDNPTNAEATSKNDFPTSKEVYDYAQSEFDSLTNFGDDYSPEEHDELVIQKTADYFDIDYETANQLYMEEATGIKDGTKFKSTIEHSSEMTMDLFKLLQPNMTYEEVTALTNLEGTLDLTMSSTSEGIESYKYDGVGYSSLSLMFFDGKLASTSQAGLVGTPALSLEGYEQLVKGMPLSEVLTLLGEGEYTGFMDSPNNGLLTSYTYKLNSHYIQFAFYDGYLFEVPTLPTN
ncbi:hypothetical protein ACQKM9_14375 [Viridibacillus sp. NPDC093762]|uniref:hypothetical protein n=1 Tax=Viridibacillus sp. NPDC093762 TaxID=3390720 RepID=UPI003CFEBDEA